MEYQWSFPALDVVYNEGDFANVVKTVHWRYRALERVVTVSDTPSGDGDLLGANDEPGKSVVEYSAEFCGSVTLPTPGQPFTAFEDLTPEIVTGWVADAMGPEQVAAMTAGLGDQIEAQKNPVQGSVPPPWA